MGGYDDAIGSILIGTWLSSVLEALIIKGTIEYYSNYANDSMLMKVFVGAVVVVDFAALISAYATVYLASVTYWGNPVALTNQFWSIPLCLVCTGLLGVLVQLFLIHRVWSLSKNLFMVAILGLGSIAAFGGATTSAGIISMFTLYSERYKARIPVIFWLTSATVTDIGITGTLIFWLYSLKTNFKHTESIIHRLIRVSIQTGSAPTALAIATLIAYAINNSSNIEAGITFVLCRSYVLTLLYNINIRATRPELDRSTHEDSDRIGTAGLSNTIDGVPLSGIQVHRTAHIQYDEEFNGIVKKGVTFRESAPNKIDIESDREST